MRIEIVRGDNLKQERWCFAVRIDYSNSCIYFDDYFKEFKETMRQRIWRIEGHWNRLDHRYNAIQIPPLPDDVKVELYQKVAEFVETLPIKM